MGRARKGRMERGRDGRGGREGDDMGKAEQEMGTRRARDGQGMGREGKGRQGKGRAGQRGQGEG